MNRSKSPTTDPPLIQLPLFEFEGPLELLLNLVERRRLPIVELSLAEVADQYLAHVRARGVTQDALADFLAIGARLVVIKSRALLPREDSNDVADDEESAEDLVRRLAVYRTFRLLAAELARIDSNAASAFTAGALDFSGLLDPPALAPIDPSMLAMMVCQVEARIGPVAQDAALVPQVTIGERLELLRRVLREQGEVEWRSVAGRTVPEFVATFLAVLEMVRRGEIRAEQGQLFGPIRLILVEQAAVASGGVTAV